MVNAKVMEVTSARIVYRKENDVYGKDYVIDWDDVHKVEYADGRSDFRTPIPNPHYVKSFDTVANPYNNILTAAILNINDEGFGMGLAYERLIDEKGYYSFYLPVNIAFMAPGKSNGEVPATENNKSIIQVLPGIKFYPTGNRGRVRYAFGPQFSFETGRTVLERKRGSSTGTEYYAMERHTVKKYGVLLNNSLNVLLQPQIYFGLDFGIGCTYRYMLSNEPYGSRVLAQFNLRFGYRF